MRFPVAVSLQNRADDTDKDARMLNAFAEITGERARAVKRPGLDSAYTAASGQGQGLFNWNIPGGADGTGVTEILVVITGDTLNTAPTPIVKLLAFTVQPT